MCVQNVMKINASSSKRGQQKIISWTHRRLDVWRTRSIDMAEGISELSLLPGKEVGLLLPSREQLNRPRIAMLQRGLLVSKRCLGLIAGILNKWNGQKSEKHDL